MRQSKTEKFMTEYCSNHGIKLLYDPDVEKDNGICYVEAKEIHLALKYSSKQHKTAVFLHEIAHITVDRFKNKPYNSFECEYYSWFEAMKLHKKLFGKSFSRKQAEFMLKCLKSYSKSYSEFKKSCDE